MASIEQLPFLEFLKWMMMGMAHVPEVGEGVSWVTVLSHPLHHLYLITNTINLLTLLQGLYFKVLESHSLTVQ